MAGLADRLVPLAEHSIDVAKRLQEQLSELNAPFEADALQAMIDALHTRAAQAYTEVAEEIGNSGRSRVERILTRAGSRAELKDRLAAEVFPGVPVTRELGEHECVEDVARRVQRGDAETMLGVDADLHVAGRHRSNVDEGRVEEVPPPLAVDLDARHGGRAARPLDRADVAH
jgi:hypothetical protein